VIHWTSIGRRAGTFALVVQDSFRNVFAYDIREREHQKIAEGTNVDQLLLDQFLLQRLHFSRGWGLSLLAHERVPPRQTLYVTETVGNR
jgi:hypothetical protein